MFYSPFLCLRGGVIMYHSKYYGGGGDNRNAQYIPLVFEFKNLKGKPLI